jgi:predicted dinucleotide-binding enzyme
MGIAVIGAGAVGRTLSDRLAAAGERVAVGARDPDAGGLRDRLAAEVSIATVRDAIAGADTVIVAIPGAAVPELAHDLGAELEDRLVVDATNDVGAGRTGALHHVAAWRQHAPRAQLARAFCTLGWENFAEPEFDGVRATLFWCGPTGGSGAEVERLVGAVGLEPQRIGGLEAADVLDGATRLWFQLALGEGLGRHLAFRQLRDPL